LYGQARPRCFVIGNAFRTKSNRETRGRRTASERINLAAKGKGLEEFGKNLARFWQEWRKVGKRTWLRLADDRREIQKSRPPK
jgi:hypothetical protein